jgi:hypothetical protein
MPPNASSINSSNSKVETKLKSSPFNDCEKISRSTASPAAPEAGYDIDHFYLMRFCLILSFASSIQAGLAMCENGQVGYVLREKLGWNGRT